MRDTAYGLTASVFCKSSKDAEAILRGTMLMGRRSPHRTGFTVPMLSHLEEKSARSLSTVSLPVELSVFCSTGPIRNGKGRSQFNMTCD